jgi:predicted nucleotidyltransferase
MTNKSETKLQEICQTLRQYLPQIQEKYQIQQLGIFGSYVRGEQTETSDVDILIQFNPQARLGLLTFCELENILSEKLGKKVDLVMKDALKTHLSKNILREVIYL